MKFFAEYVSKLYGLRKIQDWMKRKKGKTFLDLITMSDIAYCILLVDCHHQEWMDDLEVKKEIAKLPMEDQEKYRKKRRLPRADKKSLLGREAKRSTYTGMKGVSRGYLSHGFNKERADLFKTLWKDWKDVASNREAWKRMEESWDAYVEETGFGKQWVDLRAVDSDGDGEEEELESDRFALPGDEDFCDDHAWKQVGANEGDKD